MLPIAVDEFRNFCYLEFLLFGGLLHFPNFPICLGIFSTQELNLIMNFHKLPKMGASYRYALHYNISHMYVN